jgi:hypothetical protein
MEAKELRIGNYLQTKDGKRLTGVTDIFTKDYDNWDFLCYKYQSKDVEYIPLTEEWLLKFGFENNASDNSGDEWAGGVKEHGNFRIFPNHDMIKYYPVNINEGYWLPIKLKYVHQLQNLFYCLCGKELEIQS